ncbi:MAG: cupin domain-containing protein [Armatimonadetes bacterium]|nr:cupin domain-containing protein [Armatimonadota bacterium]
MDDVPPAPRRLSGLDLRTRNDAFTVLATGETCQVAVMTVLPGQDSGAYGTEHPGSDQVLTVTAGTGEAVVSGETVVLAQGDTVLIRAGEDHQIRNTGPSPLRTLNVYSPPAY